MWSGAYNVPPPAVRRRRGGGPRRTYCFCRERAGLDALSWEKYGHCPT